MTSRILAEIARSKRPGLHVLLVTGYADLPASELARLPRLAKPYQQAELKAAIEAVLVKADRADGQWRAASSPAISSAGTGLPKR